MIDRAQSQTIVRQAAQELQQLFPESLIRAMGLEPVDDSNIDELLARFSRIHPPVFLPVFAHKADLLGLHLAPGRAWEQAPWFCLHHDEAEPDLIASDVRALPNTLLGTPFTFDAKRHRVFAEVVELASRIPGAEQPDPQNFETPRHWPEERERADAREIPAHAAQAIERSPDPEVQRRDLESLAASAPDDTHAIALRAFLVREADPLLASSLALQVLTREVPAGFPLSVGKYIRPCPSGPQLLERLRPLAMAAVTAADPLDAMRAVSYVENDAVAVLLNVASRLADNADPKGALSQTRNAAYVAGAHGNGVTRALCEQLAARAGAVEGGEVAAALASLASHVYAKGS